MLRKNIGTAQHGVVLDWFSARLLDALTPDVLQVGPNAQNASMHVWQLVSSPGTITLSPGFDPRDDRLPSVLGKTEPDCRNHAVERDGVILSGTRRCRTAMGTAILVATIVRLRSRNG